VLQILFSQVACSEENHLKFLGLRQDSSKERELFRLVIFSIRQLIELVGAWRHGVSSNEIVTVNRVPVEEEIRYRAVIFAQVVQKNLHLRVRQSVVREFEGLNDLSWGQAHESGSQGVLVEAVFEEVEGSDLLKFLLLGLCCRHVLRRLGISWAVRRLSQGRVGLNSEKTHKGLDIIEELADRLKWLEVDLVRLDGLVVLVRPN
jgi:hypothetical protein